MMSKEEQPVTRQVWARLTEAEKRNVKAAAARAGKSAQEWNRQALLEKLAREGKED